MQTFLPTHNFKDCAKILDSKRLNKQILECSQIFKALTKQSIHWANHPTVLMWQSKEKPFLKYWHEMSFEYFKRFGKHHKVGNFSKPENKIFIFDEKIYISHRYNLLLKDLDFYSENLKDFYIDENILKKLKQREGGYWWQVNPKGKKAIADKKWWDEILK
jgi:hypothetical protein